MHVKKAQDVFNLFHEKLKDEKQEKFILIMLNSKNNVIAQEIVSVGTLDFALIHPREVFKPAIKNSAAKMKLPTAASCGVLNPKGNKFSAVKNS